MLLPLKTTRICVFMTLVAQICQQNMTRISPETKGVVGKRFILLCACILQLTKDLAACSKKCIMCATYKLKSSARKHCFNYLSCRLHIAQKKLYKDSTMVPLSIQQLQPWQLLAPAIHHSLSIQ